MASENFEYTIFKACQCNESCKHDILSILSKWDITGKLAWGHRFSAFQSNSSITKRLHFAMHL